MRPNEVIDLGESRLYLWQVGSGGLFWLGGEANSLWVEHLAFAMFERGVTLGLGQLEVGRLDQAQELAGAMAVLCEKVVLGASGEFAEIAIELMTSGDGYSGLILAGIGTREAEFGLERLGAALGRLPLLLLSLEEEPALARRRELRGRLDWVTTQHAIWEPGARSGEEESSAVLAGLATFALRALRSGSSQMRA